MTLNGALVIEVCCKQWDICFQRQFYWSPVKLSLKTQEIIDGVIARGKIDADGGGSRGQQCNN